MADELPQVNPIVEKPPEPPKEDPVKAELESLKQKVSTYDGQLRKQNEDLKKYRQLAEDQDAFKAALALFANQTRQTQDEFTDTVKANQPDLLKQYEEIRKESDKKRQLEEFNSKVFEYQQRTEQSGLTKKDENYWKIREAVRQGDFEHADMLLEVKKVEPLVEKKPEVDTDKLVEERARKMLEEKGLLKTETGSLASSGKYTVKQIESMSTKEFAKAFPGGYVEVLQGIQKGIIKQ